MIDDGVIKFNCKWLKEPLPVKVPHELKYWRDKMHQLKLIGEYADEQIGYGNISLKVDGGFLISGTQTGKSYPIKDEEFTLVTSYSIANNSLTCNGTIKASSESLTHAAMYECDKSIMAIIHIHNKESWNKLINKVPTTKKEIPYGTPQMAQEIKHLFATTSVSHKKIIVMAGHSEGLIAFGKTLKEAGSIILQHN